MSIFDTIRYPITPNFELSILEQIPKEIISKWWHEDLMKHKLISFIIEIQHSTSDPAGIWDLMLFNPSIRETACKLLKKRIAEYTSE